MNCPPKAAVFGGVTDIRPRLRITPSVPPSTPNRGLLNLRLRGAFNRSGDGWITTTRLDGHRVLRVTLMNSRTSDADLERVLDGLADLGARLVETPGP